MPWNKHISRSVVWKWTNCAIKPKEKKNLKPTSVFDLLFCYKQEPLALNKEKAFSFLLFITLRLITDISAQPIFQLFT